MPGTRRAATRGTPPRWEAAVLIAAAAVLTLADLGKAVRLADRLTYFVDEVVNTEAAVSFFRHGNYTSTPIGGVFPPAISSGLVATWPSALPFLVGDGTLFQARVCLGVWCWFAGFALALTFLRRRGVDWPLGAALAAFAWATLYLVPYAQGHVQNLGEIAGALTLGWGALLLRERPLLGGAALGAAVVGGKLLYLPAALALAAVDIAPAARGSSHARRRAALVVLGLVLPLAVHQAWIAVGFGPTRVGEWWAAFVRFVADGGSGLGSGTALPLAERLRTLEWHAYPGVVRYRILLFTAGAAVAVLAALPLRRRLELPRGAPARLVAVAVVIGVSLAWYLWRSPFMYIRHIQPAMLLGLGVWLYLGWHVLAVVARGRRLWSLVAVALLALSVRHLASTVREGPLLSPQTTYARLAREPLADRGAGP